MVNMAYLTVILIWQMAIFIRIIKINICMLFILQAQVSSYTVLKIVNLKCCQYNYIYFFEHTYHKIFNSQIISRSYMVLYKYQLILSKQRFGLRIKDCSGAARVRTVEAFVGITVAMPTDMPEV